MLLLYIPMDKVDLESVPYTQNSELRRMYLLPESISWSSQT